MDVFSTTLSTLQQVYSITVFIRGVVLEVKSYESSTDDIRAKIEHEFLFLEEFKTLLFDKEDAAINYSTLPSIHKRDIEHILAALSRTTSQYGLLALKHGFNVIDTDIPAFENEAVKVESMRQHFSSWRSSFQSFRTKLTKLDWALFDKDVILKLLAEYSEWTERLRQVMFMILLVVGALGQTSRYQLIQNSSTDALGLKQVAKRQIRTASIGDMQPLEGELSEKLHSSAQNVLYHLGEYEDPSGFGSITVLLERHKLNSGLAGDLRGEEAKRAVLEPVRSLASLLCGTTSTDSEQDSIKTLECLGYVERYQRSYGLLVYQFPSNQAGDAILSLHDYISRAVTNSNAKPFIGERFFLAHSLAKTLFGVHVSGWLHKAVCSRNVLLFNEQSSPCLVPHLVGWGSARQSTPSARVNSRVLNEDSESDLEPNIYRHPDRYGKPTDKYQHVHDLYSFGVLLLEIGHWKTMSARFQKPIMIAKEKGKLPPVSLVNHHLLQAASCQELKQEMGVEYAKAADRCLRSDFQVENDDEKHTAVMRNFQTLVIDKLQLGLPL